MIEILEALLNATEDEKEVRGTRYTPHEIIQQPDSWQTTFRIVEERQTDLRSFLTKSGLDGRNSAGKPTVFLIGAGTSGYVGRGLQYLLRLVWGCEVWAVPSTDLLTNLENSLFPTANISGFHSPGPATVPKEWLFWSRRSTAVPRSGICSLPVTQKVVWRKFAREHQTGLKPDCPSPNGAITRVVNHVNIYP